jgi:hypothetical protein
MARRIHGAGNAVRAISIVFASMVAHTSVLAQAPVPAQAEAAEPDPDDRQVLRYQALIEEAVSEFAAGHFLEARALFRAAHNVMPNARTLRGIGVTSFELRAYDDAYRYLTLAMAETERPLTEAQNAEAQTLIERAARFVAIYETSALPEGTRVLIDGAPASPMSNGKIVLALGRHDLEIRLDDRVGRASITVAGGESGALPVDFPVVVAERVVPLVQAPEPEPEEDAPISPERARRARTLARVVLPISGAAIATSLILIGLGTSDTRAVESPTPGTPWSSLEEQAERAGPRLTSGYILLGVGLSSAALGTIFALRGRSPDAEGVHASLRVGPSYLGSEVTW